VKIESRLNGKLTTWAKIKMWVEVSLKGEGWGEGVSKSGKVFLERMA
jgi:hypothetical protein